MGMFFNSMRKPRGFNHQYIYVDERKEKLAKICGIIWQREAGVSKGKNLLVVDYLTDLLLNEL